MAKINEKGIPCCRNYHELKRYDTDINGRGSGGLSCNLCETEMECTDGYYNCGQGCNWDICVPCYNLYSKK